MFRLIGFWGEDCFDVVRWEELVIGTKGKI